LTTDRSTGPARPDEPDGGSVVRVVGAAILDGDACLVAQRGRDMAEPLKWEFPGGKVEPGEDPRQALMREIREELGLEVAVDRRLGIGRHQLPGRLIELEVYAATITGGELKLVEHHQAGWFRAGELDDLDWAEADRPILPTLERILGDRSKIPAESSESG
jgi:8-oxo-dGTP diphosphatase